MTFGNEDRRWGSIFVSPKFNGKIFQIFLNITNIFLISETHFSTEVFKANKQNTSSFLCSSSLVSIQLPLICQGPPNHIGRTQSYHPDCLELYTCKWPAVLCFSFSHSMCMLRIMIASLKFQCKYFIPVLNKHSPIITMERK